MQIYVYIYIYMFLHTVFLMVTLLFREPSQTCNAILRPEHQEWLAGSRLSLRLAGTGDKRCSAAIDVGGPRECNNR